jgi:hypothetical protein
MGSCRSLGPRWTERERRDAGETGHCPDFQQGRASSRGMPLTAHSFIFPPYLPVAPPPKIAKKYIFRGARHGLLERFPGSDARRSWRHLPELDGHRGCHRHRRIDLVGGATNRSGTLRQRGLDVSLSPNGDNSLYDASTSDARSNTTVR